jgi:hypothetical protein
MADAEYRVDWALLCDYALVDAGGKLSMIGVFENLFAQNFPAMHPILFHVAQWAGPPNGSIAAELRIWGPSKELIGSAQQQVQLSPVGRAGALIQLSPLPLPAAGEYVFEVLGGGVSQHHTSVTVGYPPA